MPLSTFVDTNIPLNVLNKEKPPVFPKDLYTASFETCKLVETGRIEGSISSVTVYEILHLPIKMNDVEQMRAGERLLGIFDSVALDYEAAKTAARVRAKYKLPHRDSLIAGCAIKKKPAFFITRDATFKVVKELNIKTPEEFLNVMKKHL